MIISPHLQLELDLLARGYWLIAGVDEAGRGAWAGPVVAAAVILPLTRSDLVEVLRGVRDSKTLTPKQREELLPLVQRTALAVGIGIVSSKGVDQHGIVAATRQAMRKAIDDLGVSPDYLLIDALRLPTLHIPQSGIPKGDRWHLSIAAASIVAKVARDRILCQLERTYSGYGFAQHKGYGTPQHRRTLAELGPCAIHRYSFAPIRAVLQR